MARITWSRLIWLIDLVHRRQPISLEEISNQWERSSLGDGNPLPRRTFHNHREAIAEQFGIDIACDKRNRYYIEYGDIGSGEELKSWLLSTLSLTNTIREAEQMRHRILVDSVYNGSEYLEPIIQAMKSNVSIRISYQGYWQKEAKTYHLLPYVLKSYDRRWYLLSQDLKSGVLKIFSLDRIKEIELTQEEHRVPQDFDSKSYFAHSFGIMVDEEYDVEVIRLRAYGLRQRYIDAQPLHPSQKLVQRTEEWSEYELRLRADIDFQQELMRYSYELEVLSPEWLREDMAKNLKRALDRY